MKHKNIDPALVILTISDLHGSLEPSYAWGPDKTLHPAGGISRIKTVVNTIKNQYPEKVLLLGSGDFFVEDFNRGKYFSAFGPETFVSFLNTLPIDASTIGNHEFDFGVPAADAALNACSFPIIATNLKHTEMTCNILKKLIVHKNGYKIGILGVMLSEYIESLIKTVYWFLHEKGESGRAHLEFEPNLYDCMQTAVDELKKVDEVDFVVVLSHIGIDEDKKLAEQVDGIDLICGGHTHTITKKGCEVVIQKSEQCTTVISHPGDKGRTLGMIKLWEKDQGLLRFECDVLEVDTSIAQNPQLEEKLQWYKQQLPKSNVITTTACPIDTTKDAMRKRENGFANFVTDTVRDYFGVDIVLINARSVSGEEILPAGDLTQDDLDNFFTLDNDVLIKLKVSGKQIREALELGADDILGKSRNLLHVSGLQYMIDPSMPALVPLKNSNGITIGSIKDGTRVLNVTVEQHYKGYTELNDTKLYDIIINNMLIDESFYLAHFYMFKAIQDKHNLGLTLKDVLIEYCKKHPVICPTIDGRLIIKN